MRLSTRKLELAPNVPWTIVGPASMRTLTRMSYMPNSGNTPPTPPTLPPQTAPHPGRTQQRATWPHVTQQIKFVFLHIIIINAAIAHGHSENLDFPMYFFITRNNTKTYFKQQQEVISTKNFLPCAFWYIISR